MKSTRTLITIATVVAIIVVAVFIGWPKPIKDRLDGEVFKLTYEFFLIVVLGGALSLLYKRLEDERKKDAAKDEWRRTQRDSERNLQRELRTEVVRAYHNAKKIRRLLRAKAREYLPDTVTTILHPDPYNQQMELLIDTQLEFEFFVDRVRSNPGLFSGAANLLTNLEKVERYLNQLVGEYEDSRSIFSLHQGRPTLSCFQYLEEFIGPYKLAAAFKSDLKEPLKDVISQLETLVTAQ
jgi:hypothetical protein